MAEASRALAGLAVEYRHRQARLVSDADYCERQARAAEEAASREEAHRLANLQIRAAALKKQIDQERRVHEVRLAPTACSLLACPAEKPWLCTHHTIASSGMPPLEVSILADAVMFDMMTKG